MHHRTRVETLGGVVVVHVAGDVDISGAPDLRSLLLRHLDQGAANFVLDLEGCDFVDSIGLGTILGFLRRVRARSGRLEIVVPHEHQRRLLVACDFDQIFELHADVESAVRAADPAPTPS